MAVGIGAEITMPYHRLPFGRAHRFAETFQQRRRVGHPQTPQQPARRERGAREGASQVEVLHAVVEVPRCQASLEVHVFKG